MSTMTGTSTTRPIPSRGETRIAVRGASWRLYELWIDSLPPSSGIRMAYDGEDPEIMTKGPAHWDFRSLLGKFGSEISVDLGVPHKCLGETIWKRPEVSRGLEADQCYADIVHWLTVEDSSDESGWTRRLRDWGRNLLVPRTRT